MEGWRPFIEMAFALDEARHVSSISPCEVPSGQDRINQQGGKNSCTSRVGKNLNNNKQAYSFIGDWRVLE